MFHLQNTTDIILKMGNWHTPEDFLYNMSIPTDKHNDSDKNDICCTMPVFNGNTQEMSAYFYYTKTNFQVKQL